MQILIVYALSLVAAHAHLTRSESLMADLTRADTRVSLVLGKCAYNPPEDADIDAALAALDVAIASADRNAGNCEADLFPAAVRELSAEAQSAYGRQYAFELARFAAVLREMHREFELQRELPLASRTSVRLGELKNEMRQLTNEVHRKLKRRHGG